LDARINADYLAMCGNRASTSKSATKFVILDEAQRLNTDR
jgi:hypothetical protein